MRNFILLLVALAAMAPGTAWGQYGIYRPVAMAATDLSCTACVDISSETNLAVTSPITLTGDTVGCATCAETNQAETVTTQWEWYAGGDEACSIATDMLTCFNGASNDRLSVYDNQLAYLDGATGFTAIMQQALVPTSDAYYYLPPDEPVATYLLNMDSSGNMGFDTNTYLTAETDPRLPAHSTDGNVLQSTGAAWESGVLDIHTSVLFGGTSFLHSTGGADNLFIGVDAGDDGPVTGHPNLGLGGHSLQLLTDGIFNTALGESALATLTSGDYNTAIGIHALSDLTTGSLNTMVGQGAGEYLTNESYNTGVGQYAMVMAGSPTTGAEYNTAIGYHALSEIGSGPSGDANLAAGVWAGRYITTGSYNTILGSYSGTPGGITTGTYNTCIGANACNSASQKVDAANSIAVGNGAYTTADNVAQIGNASVTAGYVGTHQIAVLDSAQTFTAAQMIDGSSDTVQLTVQGHTAQTAYPFVIEDSTGADKFYVSNTGAAQSIASISANTYLYAGTSIVANNVTPLLTGAIYWAPTITNISSHVGLRLAPTYNQASGTAANTDLLINRTVTAVGSGLQKGLDIQVGGTSSLSVGVSAARPTCDATTRFMIFTVAGGAGVADTVEICTKDAADAYAWRTLI